MNEGDRFGRWVVISPEEVEKKVLCRCDCGTERYVLKRSLIYGGSLSCGCLRKERAAEAVTEDLTGREFGELKVIKRLEDTSRGGVRYLTKCSCGNEYEVLGSLLTTGRRTRCSGKAHKKNYAYTDITGQRFEMLTALYPLDKRDPAGYMMWHCRCECGNEIDVSYNTLMYTGIKSCGCRKKEHDKQLQGFLNRVAGTTVENLKSKKIPTDNTTGYKGVYHIKGKYVAKIVFQKKAYYLGTYDDILSAAEARKEAEETLFDGMSRHYELWQKKAKEDPEWAADNPVDAIVSKGKDNRLSVKFLPDMSEIIAIEKYMKTAVS